MSTGSLYSGGGPSGSKHTLFVIKKHIFVCLCGPCRLEGVHLGQKKPLSLSNTLFCESTESMQCHLSILQGLHRQTKGVFCRQIHVFLDHLSASLRACLLACWLAPLLACFVCLPACLPTCCLLACLLARSLAGLLACSSRMYIYLRRMCLFYHIENVFCDPLTRKTERKKNWQTGRQKERNKDSKKGAKGGAKGGQKQREEREGETERRE